MNEQIKEDWIKALRSNEYQQGTGRLRIRGDNGELYFCCLGVLCDLHSKQTGTQWLTSTDGDTMYAGVKSQTALLPEIVLEWSGISSHTTLSRLANLNDTGTEFLEIANVIERIL